MVFIAAFEWYRLHDFAGTAGTSPRHLAGLLNDPNIGPTLSVVLPVNVR